MERYEAYKDSGVEWIGEIPEEWIVARLDNCLSLNQGGVWGDDPPNGEGTVVLRSTEQTVDGFWRIESPAKRNLDNEPHIEEKMLAIDDLLVTKSSGSELHIGKTTIVDEEVVSLNCTYSNFMQRLRTNERLRARFCWYLLNSDLARSQYCYLQNSTSGIGNLNADTIADIYIPVPPHVVQECITDYLDAKTAEVDALVADCEREAGLLREYRKAVISEAVTKGLDPDAPMKDSGVGWIGEIPDRWQCVKLGLISVSTLGRMLDSEKQAGDCLAPYLSNRDVQWFCIDSSDLKEMDFPLETRGSYEIRDGDMLVCEGGEVGRCAVWHGPSPDFYFQKAIHRVRFNQDVITADFAAYQMYQKAQVSMFREVRKGESTIGHLPGDQLRQLTLIAPPLNEQRRIVDYLNAKTAEIDSLIEAKQQMADKLREYRKSLISEAVTGKFKVPGVK